LKWLLKRLKTHVLRLGGDAVDEVIDPVFWVTETWFREPLLYAMTWSRTTTSVPSAFCTQDKTGGKRRGALSLCEVAKNQKPAPAPATSNSKP
jgi:hypothetical protein